MKKVMIFCSFLFCVTLVAQAQCDSELSTRLKTEVLSDDSKGTFLMNKWFKNSKDREKPKVEEFTVVLNAGSRYGFYVLSSEKYEGNAQFRLLDKKGKVLAEKKAEADHSVEYVFTASKSGKYSVQALFEDGKKGCAVLVLTVIL